MQFRRLGIPSLKHIQPPRRALLSLAQGITNELLLFRVLTMKCQREEDTGFPVAQQWKNPPAMQETQETRDLSLGREDEGEMTTHSSILAWRIPGTEEPSRLQSMGLQGVGHNWATEHVHKREGHSETRLWKWRDFGVRDRIRASNTWFLEVMLREQKENEWAELCLAPGLPDNAEEVCMWMAELVEGLHQSISK